MIYLSLLTTDVFELLNSDEPLMQAMINGVNGSIIALAVYELAMVIQIGRAHV